MIKNNSSEIEDFSDCLKDLKEYSDRFTIFCGFDGFVDVLYKVVKKESQGEVRYYNTIEDFGTRINKAAGLSADIEIVKIYENAGGNAPIFAEAISNMNTDVLLCANLGTKDVHPVFKELGKKCNIINLGEPASTIAFEFNDGKIMFGDILFLKELHKINLEKILIKYYGQHPDEQIDLACMADWANISNCSLLWKQLFGFLEKQMVDDGKVPKIFMDLADISAKDTGEILELIDLINHYGKIFQIILGLNLNETRKLYEILFNKSCNITNLIHSGVKLKSRLHIHAVVVHSTYTSFAFTDSEKIYTEGRKIYKPAVSTGGGDNFNAGFCYAWLKNLTWGHALLMGMLFSAYYVENGKSISPEDVSEYYEYWKKLQVQ